MMPTTLELNLRAGEYRADRDRLIELIFAIEAGLTDGTAPAHWRDLLKTAHWMRDTDGRGTDDGTR